MFVLAMCLKRADLIKKKLQLNGAKQITLYNTDMLKIRCTESVTGENILNFVKRNQLF